MSSIYFLLFKIEESLLPNSLPMPPRLAASKLPRESPSQIILDGSSLRRQHPTTTADYGRR
jgi:hypothetical protein